jgi:general secretion pathway protein A
MYTHFYGFSEEPFRDSPDPRFLFLTPSHQQALGYLIRGIEEKSGWVMLTGEPGTGKTILIHHLLESLKGRSGLKSAIIFQPRNSLEDILKEILLALDLPQKSPPGIPISEHFSRFLEPILSCGDSLVIFLDEAQGFSVEVLEKISNFFGNGHPNPGQFQIIVSGQPLLEEKLQSSVLHHLNQRIKFRCLIKPLTSEESQRYIAHRLQVAAGDPGIINPEALRLITHNGEGIPRTISVICDNTFRIGHQLSEAPISANIVRKALREMYSETKEPGFSEKPTKVKSFFRKIVSCVLRSPS